MNQKPIYLELESVMLGLEQDLKEHVFYSLCGVVRVDKTQVTATSQSEPYDSGRKGYWLYNAQYN